MWILIALILIIAAFFMGLHFYNRKRLQRLTNLAPKDLVTYQGINLVPHQAVLNQIGLDRQHPIKYIGVDDQHRVVFPESRLGNRVRYYLAAVSSKSPLSSSRSPQANVNSALSTKWISSDDAMQSNQAYLILIKSDFSDAFAIRIKIQGQDVNALKRRFALSQARLRSLREKAN